MAFSCLYVINLWRKAVVNVSEKWWLSGAEYIVATHLWKRRKCIRVVSLLSVVVDIELGLQKAKDMNEIFDIPLIHNAGNCQIYLFYRGSPWSQLSAISIPQSVLTSSTLSGHQTDRKTQLFQSIAIFLRHFACEKFNSLCSETCNAPTFST